ncbi:MAG TPA: acyl-CoA carboxylase subunit epsilon [Amnibacterium sp.]
MSPSETPHVLGGSATDEEIAAIAAVFAQLQAERAAAGARTIQPGAAASLWERRHGLRRASDMDGGWTDPR